MITLQGLPTATPCLRGLKMERSEIRLTLNFFRQYARIISRSPQKAGIKGRLTEGVQFGQFIA